VLACALTVHKSQGGTFERIVYDYKSQQTSLVYVGLSRVTNIDRLYLTNANNNFNFYHGRGSNAPGLKEMTDEYLLLERYRLYTEKTDVEKFCGHTTTLLTTTTKQSFLVTTQSMSEQ
jgi:hypothetical protein